MFGTKAAKPIELMKIRLRTCIAGQRLRKDPTTGEESVIGHFEHHVGDLIEWPKDEALRYIEAGMATADIEQVARESLVVKH